MAIQQPIRKALNQAFRKLAIERASFDRFRGGVRELLDGVATKPDESEEHYKNLLASFLAQSFYPSSRPPGEEGELWAINTSDRIDLTIAKRSGKGKAITEEIGVLFEVKKPKNIVDMPTHDRLNVKALQQLLYYFLQERLTRKNVRIRHLVITNIHEWFLFDARLIEALFVRDREFVRAFEDFEAGRLSYRTTEEFYKQAAASAIDRHGEALEYAYFDLRSWDSDLDDLESEDEAVQKQLAELYKVFSPEHLFGLPFANDSNTLDRQFYSELLHILGLREYKDKNKKVIDRLPVEQRDRGSIIENTIVQLDRCKKLRRLPGVDLEKLTIKPKDSAEIIQEKQAYKEELLYETALELTITWVNRILFSKLLEAQLLSYHHKERSYQFLTVERIPNYGELSALFFEVLAVYRDDRDETVTIFDAFPYLNSSLFELTELEHLTLSIGELRNSLTMRVFERTVLKDKHNNTKKRSGLIMPLAYLLEFLGAYDFGSEAIGHIREESRSLISASVLGLIFEKINGYKDGAFFTPGYVTMYMCRETLRRAVVEAFNDRKGWDCQTFDDLYNRIQDKAEANAIINDLKICDPSVGSGHFLVSALNELIAIKSDLGILCDQNGRMLRDYSVRVENDELVVTDEDGELFSYRPKNANSLRVQKTLFEEKRRIIENCLFGVDVNPNSVSICRLRLWIELLKHAYYTDSETRILETLPNIDINIKPGNSVISRYAIDLEIQPLLKKAGYTIEQYREAVQDYREAMLKDEKWELERFIQQLKADLRSEISADNPLLAKRAEKEKARQELRRAIIVPTGDAVRDRRDRERRNQQDVKLKQEIEVLTEQIEAEKSGKIFQNALEWRFEFPEVLDNEGNFTGFDVIVGNPPYVRQEEIKEFKPYLKELFSTYTGVADLFVYFYELGLRLLKPGGYLTFISSNKYFRAGYGEKLRRLLAQETTIANLIDFGDYPVFEEAIAYPSIITLRKRKPAADHGVRALSWDGSRSEPVQQFGAVLGASGLVVQQSELTAEGWRLESGAVLDLLAKLRGAGTPLGEYVEGRFYYGIKTGFNEAFVVDRVTRDRLVAEDARSAEVLKPYLRGRDVKRWVVNDPDLWLLFIPWHFPLHKDSSISGASKVAEEAFKKEYPAVYNHLLQYKEQLSKRNKAETGIRYEWYALQRCAASYFDEFEKSKILYQEIATYQAFSWDESNSFSNNKTFLIPDTNKFLLAVLNSSITWFFLNHTVGKMAGGTYAMQTIYISQIPIPDPKKDPDRVNQIETLVQQILDRKQTNPSADVNDLETAINQHIYQLYDLTPDEIAIIETTIKP